MQQEEAEIMIEQVNEFSSWEKNAQYDVLTCKDIDGGNGEEVVSEG